MIVKRSIRLKEFVQNSQFIRSASIEYYEKNPKLEKNKFYYFRTDDDGFMYGLVKDFYEKDLIMLGDSSVENLFVENHYRVIDFLGRGLVRVGLDYNIKNGGGSGASLLHLLNIVDNKVLLKKNPIIFLFIPSNESSIMNLEGFYWNSDKLNSNLVGGLNETKINLKKDDLSFFEKLLKTFIDVCKNFEINLHVFSIIRLKEKKIYKQIDQKTREICSENDIIYHDINKKIAKDENFYDDLHLNACGSENLANILVEICVKNLFPTKTNTYFLNSDVFFKNKKILYLEEKTINILSGKDFNVNSDLKLNLEAKGLITQESFDKDNIDCKFEYEIGICNKVYSKYNTFIVFDYFDCKIKLSNEISDNQHSIHVYKSTLFFVNKSDIFYIKYIFNSKCMVSSDVDGSANYSVELKSDYIIVNINDCYLSASNLMVLKVVNQLKSCEKFYLKDDI